MREPAVRFGYWMARTGMQGSVLGFRSYWPDVFRDQPLGQNDSWIAEVTFDCLPVAITGKFHISY